MLPCGRVEMKERYDKQRESDFDEVEYGMTYEEAMQEASRCLRCDYHGFGSFRGGRGHKMVTLTINGQQISVPERTTIMEAAEKVGIHIPHLCFLKDINEIAACRVCLVELIGIDKLVTACDTECRDGIGDFHQ